jgi:hypothetical protein
MSWADAVIHGRKRAVSATENGRPSNRAVENKCVEVGYQLAVVSLANGVAIRQDVIPHERFV